MGKDQSPRENKTRKIANLPPEKDQRLFSVLFLFRFFSQCIKLPSNSIKSNTWEQYLEVEQNRNWSREQIVRQYRKPTWFCIETYRST